MTLEQINEDGAEHDGAYAIAYALLRVAYQLKYLGNGNAATPMGAIEALGAVHKEGLASIADALASNGLANVQAPQSGANIMYGQANAAMPPIPPGLKR